ncbi:hypothetical protein PsorP6_015251 [Peronosclerospora sorghi]|uniref:Uncharacterized protein n=1 Tax=Peronosclerospora sorghi TaxID=230839 RepID=A0ACC0VRN4_9STRA|nr:hypothetical protein PsorP6_015251 [Peronosclerospora sorghi]
MCNFQKRLNIWELINPFRQMFKQDPTRFQRFFNLWDLSKAPTPPSLDMGLYESNASLSILHSYLRPDARSKAHHALEHALLVLQLAQRRLLVVFEPIPRVPNRTLDVRIALLARQLNGPVNKLLQVVARFNATEHLGVILLKLVGLGHHAVNVFLAQAAAVV